MSDLVIARARGLAALLVVVLVAGLVVTVGSVAAPAGAAVVDPRVPGPSNPVGPTNWNVLVDQSSFVNYSSGGNVTVENVRFLNGFEVTNGTNLTIRNCHVINPGSFWTILVRSGSLLMEDCQIGDDTTAAGQRGIGGDNVTLRRVKIVGHSDGIKTGDDSLYEQVWVTDLREFEPDDHPDAMQDDGGGGDYIIRYSRLEGIDINGARGTSAAIIKSDLGPINNVTFEHNVLDGGQYALMVDKGNSYPAPTNVVIRNNAFGRNSVYGVLLRDDNAGITWENNFWEDTGQCIDWNGNIIGNCDGTPTTTTLPPGGQSGSVDRLAGSDRYATAVAVSQHAFGSASVAYVVSGENYPDALVAASRGNGPVLLVRRDSVPAATLGELGRLSRLNRIYVVGGSAVVSDAVLNQLEPYARRVIRVAGSDRYETAAAFSERFHGSGGPVYVATGAAYADALAAAAVAGHEDAPLLLVSPTSVPDAIGDELSRIGPSRIYVVGGPAAISDAVKATLASYGPVERISGNSRYGTAAALSAATFGNGGDVYIASGLAFPDALVAAAAAVAGNAPVLLVTNTTIPASTRTELNRLDADEIYLVGGTAVVTSQVQTDLAAYEN